MVVSLNKAYQGLTAGSVVELPASTEAALIAQGIATASSSAVTSGAYTTNLMQGTAVIPAGSSSVVITNPKVDATTKVFAVVAQATADATLLRVERIVSGAGLFTIYGTANATAATVIDWHIFNSEVDNVSA
jgi:hypothetical protein